MKKKQPKKPKEFAKNKQAFDRVMAHVRNLEGSMVGSIGAVQLGGSGGGSKDLVKPTPVDFRCDVSKAIKAKCPKDISLVAFEEAYLEYDSEDAIEREMHAQKVLGNRRHSVEQRVGEEFIRRGIFPVQGKGYFFHIRVGVPR